VRMPSSLNKLRFEAGAGAAFASVAINEPAIPATGSNERFFNASLRFMIVYFIVNGEL